MWLELFIWSQDWAGNGHRNAWKWHGHAGGEGTKFPLTTEGDQEHSHASSMSTSAARPYSIQTDLGIGMLIGQ